MMDSHQPNAEETTPDESTESDEMSYLILLQAWELQDSRLYEE